LKQALEFRVREETAGTERDKCQWRLKLLQITGTSPLQNKGIPEFVILIILEEKHSTNSLSSFSSYSASP
jgi:hypothetical protein